MTIIILSIIVTVVAAALGAWFLWRRDGTTSDEADTAPGKDTTAETAPEPMPEQGHEDVPEPQPTTEQGHEAAPEPEPTPEPEPEPEPTPEPEPENVGAKASKTLDECLAAFADYILVPKGCQTYGYLTSLVEECEAQLQRKSIHGLPVLMRPDNFPSLCPYYGTDGDTVAMLDTMKGWVLALQLAELKPKKRHHLFRVGYELGGYNADSPLYGYDFTKDPQVGRLTASMIYVAMRGRLKPDIATMRIEVGGSSYPHNLNHYLNIGLNNLKTAEDIQKNVITKSAFYVDLREFMPSSAGPYAPGYEARPPHPMSDKRDDYDNLEMDRLIHEHIVKTFNLDTQDADIRQMTVQAIADKEQSTAHLFGTDRTVKQYSFHPVFGQQTIGKEIKLGGTTALLTYYIQAISTYFRLILQNKADAPAYFGRLRPGCSWTEEKVKNSDTDDRRNVLVDIAIEDNDGQKTSSYGYDDDGIWRATEVEASEYAEHQKNHLGANSYPSGHSSGIWTVAMMLAEAMPDRADLIMKEANQFAINRTITRFHWTSDTIYGRVLGSVASAMCHATYDYDALLEATKTELL